MDSYMTRKNALVTLATHCENRWHLETKKPDGILKRLDFVADIDLGFGFACEDIE